MHIICLLVRDTLQHASLLSSCFFCPFNSKASADRVSWWFNTLAWNVNRGEREVELVWSCWSGWVDFGCVFSFFLSQLEGMSGIRQGLVVINPHRISCRRSTIAGRRATPCKGGSRSTLFRCSWCLGHFRIVSTFFFLFPKHGRIILTRRHTHDLT